MNGIAGFEVVKIACACGDGHPGGRAVVTKDGTGDEEALYRYRVSFRSENAARCRQATITERGGAVQAVRTGYAGVGGRPEEDVE